jgi:thymidylate synthase
MVTVIHQPSITSAWNMLWRNVWFYGKRIVDQRGDKVREVRRVFVEIETPRINYPEDCPVNKVICDKFTDSLIDPDEANKFQDSFDYSYGGRIYSDNQLGYIIDQLKDNPMSRRAVVAITNPRDANKSEVPCATQIYFDVAGSDVNMTLSMRSNDVFNAFPTDAYGFRKVQQKVADETGYSIGNYYHYINNAHIIEHTSEDNINRLLHV